MGLSAPKNRSKLSNDPNNTHWSRSTERFGHKILAAQGWTPGSYLGAKDAAHAEHYSVASASHIRVILRDDNAGLGIKRGQNAETFGLDGLQGLLGRLNGKSDTELQKEEDSRRNVQLQIYQGRKHGTMNFVSGGFLVGDKVEDKLVSTDMNRVPGPKKPEMADVRLAVSNDDAVKRSKKRKRVGEDGDHVEGKRPKPADSVDDSSEPSDTNAVKSKREKRRKTRETKLGGNTNEDADEPDRTGPSSDEKAEKKRRKLERRAKKEAKKVKKEAKRFRKEERRKKKAKSKADSADSSSSDNEEQPPVQLQESVKVAQIPTPTVSFSSGRHAVRQRYIQQKRLAAMDPQALKEIFMIKAQ